MLLDEQEWTLECACACVCGTAFGKTYCRPPSSFITPLDSAPLDPNYVGFNMTLLGEDRGRGGYHGNAREVGFTRV